MWFNMKFFALGLTVLLRGKVFRAAEAAPLKVPKVLVIGGTGRVGGSAVRSLNDRFGSEIDLWVAGRSEKNWDLFLERAAQPLTGVQFLPLDIYQQSQLDVVIPQYDLIIHTAGPFQGIRDPTVMETSLRHGRQYIDVCDDITLSSIARSEKYRKIATDSGAAAVISTGIWPGGSSLFAQKIIEAVGGKDEVDKVKFTFFTAGTGNAGPTLLAATFLILGEDVLTYVKGKKVYKKSATDLETVDFGKDIGMREVVRLNLIECESCHSSGITLWLNSCTHGNQIAGVLFAVVVDLLNFFVTAQQVLFTYSYLLTPKLL